MCFPFTGLNDGVVQLVIELCLDASIVDEMWEKNKWIGGQGDSPQAQ
jgi:hypothetical protein